MASSTEELQDFSPAVSSPGNTCLFAPVFGTLCVSAALYFKGSSLY